MEWNVWNGCEAPHRNDRAADVRVADIRGGVLSAQDHLPLPARFSYLFQSCFFGSELDLQINNHNRGCDLVQLPLFAMGFGCGCQFFEKKKSCKSDFNQKDV